MIRHYLPKKSNENQHTAISRTLTSAAHTTGSGVAWLGHYRTTKNGKISSYSLNDSIVTVSERDGYLESIAIWEETEETSLSVNAIIKLQSLLNDILVEVGKK